MAEPWDVVKEEGPAPIDPWEIQTGEFRPEWERFSGFRSAPFGTQSCGESGGGFFEGDKLLSLEDWANTPLSPEDFISGRAQFGNKFQSAGPLTRQRYQATVDAGFPGIDLNALGFGNRTPPNPMFRPPPPFLNKLYSLGQGETIQSLTTRAKKGVKGWTSGGPDAPKILTPVEWDAMLPSEQEGLLGFLEYIGIPADDYQYMMKRQKQQVAESFGFPSDSKTPFTPFNFQPARQR